MYWLITFYLKIYVFKLPWAYVLKQLIQSCLPLVKKQFALGPHRELYWPSDSHWNKNNLCKWGIISPCLQEQLMTNVCIKGYIIGRDILYLTSHLGSNLNSNTVMFLWLLNRVICVSSKINTVMWGYQLVESNVRICCIIKFRSRSRTLCWD